MDGMSLQRNGVKEMMVNYLIEASKKRGDGRREDGGRSTISPSTCKVESSCKSSRELLRKYGKLCQKIGEQHSSWREYLFYPPSSNK